MSKYEVRVIGGKSPKRGDGPVRRLLRRTRAAIRAALLRPGMIVLAGIAAFVLLVGTPHVAWDYQCRHPMQGYGTCRAVSWCAYYGIQGRRVETPELATRCTAVTVLPVEWSKLIERVL